MARYIAQRLLTLIPILFGVTIIVFGIMKLVPGDPALMAAGVDARQEDVERIRAYLGLDRPIHEQYLSFVGNAVTGNFGVSARTRRPVIEEVGARFPATAELAIAGLFVSMAIGVTAGIISATKQYTIWDNLVMTVALLGVSMPVFWLGLMMMMLFSVELGWLPTTGRGTWQQLIMPSFALGFGSAAIVARQTRSAMLEVLRQDYVQTARSKGLPERAVILRHALKNAAIPSVTIIGLQFGGMLGGTVITETVFAWPGMGRLIVEAIGFRDLQVVQAGILILATIFVLTNLIVDLLYVYLDPRIKYG
jgi:ABC-type dipeptide/oligopeptide/nickel transport system permease component